MQRQTRVPVSNKLSMKDLTTILTDRFKNESVRKNTIKRLRSLFIDDILKKEFPDVYKGRNNFKVITAPPPDSKPGKKKTTKKSKNSPKQKSASELIENKLSKFIDSIVFSIINSFYSTTVSGVPIYQIAINDGLIKKSTTNFTLSDFRSLVLKDNRVSVAMASALQRELFSFLRYMLKRVSSTKQRDRKKLEKLINDTSSETKEVKVKGEKKTVTVKSFENSLYDSVFNILF